jgi:hypothetical protein
MASAVGYKRNRDRDLSLADTYREYAAECLRLAHRAKNERDRARLVAMAQAWRELAEKIGSPGEQAGD